MSKPVERADDKWPNKFEDLVSYLSDRALTGSAWFGRESVIQHYQDSYINLAIQGMGVRLADLPDSEAIAERIIDPLLAMYREAVGQS